MLTITNHTLEKLELLLRTAGYRVRYEKGNFKTGACLLLNSKVVVVNKYYALEGKVNCLCEILRTIELDTSMLSEKNQQFYAELINKPAQS